MDPGDYHHMFEETGIEVVYEGIRDNRISLVQISPAYL